MKLWFYRHSWPIPRPQVYAGWEGHSIWAGVAFGTPQIDSILDLSVTHDLTDRQLGALEKVTTRVETFRVGLRNGIAGKKL